MWSSHSGSQCKIYTCPRHTWYMRLYVILWFFMLGLSYLASVVHLTQSFEFVMIYWYFRCCCWLFYYFVLRIYYILILHFNSVCISESGNWCKYNERYFWLQWNLLYHRLAAMKRQLAHVFCSLTRKKVCKLSTYIRYSKFLIIYIFLMLNWTFQKYNHGYFLCCLLLLNILSYLLRKLHFVT